MKTVFNIKIINHLGACIIAALGLSLVSAIALPTVNLNLSGEIFGQDDDEDSVDLNINSAARRLTAATSYKFSLQGNCAGTGALGSAIKPGTPIKDFIDYVQADASSSLKGTFSNPRGRLPIVLIEKTFSGTKKIRNVGDVWISVTVKGGADIQGRVYLKITKIMMIPWWEQPDSFEGGIRFEKGAKFVVAGPTVIQIKRTVRNRHESNPTGDVDIEILKIGIGRATVIYRTEDAGADSGDYTGTTGTVGTVVTLNDAETKKIIRIPNPPEQGSRWLPTI